MHQDSSLLSFNIALSPFLTHEEYLENHLSSPAGTTARRSSNVGYEGGGTFFVLSNATVHTDIGDATLHPSNLFHAGEFDT